jgi:hypothetical protein
MTYQPAVHFRDGGNTLAAKTGGRINPFLSVTNLTTAGAGTYTAAAIAGGVITRDCNGGSRTDTTATAAAIIAACKLENDGEAALCYVINISDAAEVITLEGGTDVTFNAENLGQTIARNEAALVIFVRASATTVNAYIIGA